MKCVVAMLVLACMAGGTHAADFLEIYREAERSDPRLAAARMQLEASREQYPQARAGLLPALSLTGSVMYDNLAMDRPLARNQGFNTNTYSLQLTQPLFRWQNHIALEQGQLAVNVAEARFASARMDLVWRTAQAYFELLEAGDVWQAEHELRKAAEAQLVLSEKSFSVGVVTVTDVDDAKARRDLAAAQEIAAQNDIDVKREALRVLIGREPPVLDGLGEHFHMGLPEPQDPRQWVDAALNNNLDVQAQLINRQIAEQEIARRRAARLPAVDAVASYSNVHAGATTLSASEYRYHDWSVGVQASMPLFEGGSIRSRIREAVALREKALDDLEAARRAASQSARQAYLGLVSGIAQIRGYEAAYASSLSSLESNRLGYRVGVKINMDVLNAQFQLADAAQKLAKARYDAILCKVRLQQAVGTLSVEDVRQLNALLKH